MVVLESSDSSLPTHLQWTLSRDFFQKVFSKSMIGHGQPLLLNNKTAINRNYSCGNELYAATGTRGRPVTPFYPSQSVHARRALWPRGSALGPCHLNHPDDPVTISDVCRTATPLLPPPIREESEGVSWVTAAFLLVNAAIGIGILNFPAAYDLAGGIASSMCTQLGMLCLIVCTMLILAHCSDVNLDSTYHDVLLSMCGRSAQRLAALSITATCYGVCVAIFIIIGDQLDSILLAWYGGTFCHHWYMERHFTIPLTSCIFMLPMCFSRSVHFLRYAGSLGIFAMLYPVFLTIYGYFKLDVKNVEIKHEPDSVTKYLVVVPVLCFAYQCQEVVVPVYACMRERTLGQFARASCLAMAFLFALYSLIGCFGYLTFGALVSPNIMKMYDATDPLVAVGSAALVLKMIVTYPVLALCGRGAVEGLYAELRRLSTADFVKSELRRRCVITVLWFSSSLLLALYTSSIGTVIHALGSVSSANIFIYPGICLMRVTLQTDPDLRLRRSYFFLVASVALAAVGAFFFGIILMDALWNGSPSGKSGALLCQRPSS